MTLQIGFLLFPQVQQLDLTGPYDVLASLPDVKVHLIWKDLVPVTSSTGLVLKPTTTFDDCPPLDVICIPGGSGVGPLMEDEQTLAFIKAQAANARYITSVCTGALVLGAAGLLKGKRATTHWAYHELLAPLGAIPVKDRVVRDGNLLTGGGICGHRFCPDAGRGVVRQGHGRAGAVAARIRPGTAVYFGQP